MVSRYRLGAVMAEKANVTVGSINRCVTLENKEVTVLLLSIVVTACQILHSGTSVTCFHGPWIHWITI